MPDRPVPAVTGLAATDPDAATRRVALTFETDEEVGLLLPDVLRAVKVGRPDLYDRITKAECVVVTIAKWERPRDRSPGV